MKKSTRVLLTGIVIELLLIGGGLWFAGQNAAGTIGYDGPNAEAAARTMEVVGAAVVPLAIVFAMLFFSLRRKRQ